MSSAIQFNKITKVKNPDSIKNGVDASKLSCEWIDAASAPSHNSVLILECTGSRKFWK